MINGAVVYTLGHQGDLEEYAWKAARPTYKK